MRRLREPRHGCPQERSPLPVAASPDEVSPSKASTATERSHDKRYDVLGGFTTRCPVTVTSTDR